MTPRKPAKPKGEPRRKRCQGKCGKLYPSDQMVRVGTRWVCDTDYEAELAAQKPPGESDTDKQARIAKASQNAGITQPQLDDDLAQGIAEQATPGEAFAQTERPVGSLVDRMAQAVEAAGGRVQPASTLPAPSTQPSLTVDLGDPDEILAQRRDLPDEKPPGWPLRHGRLSASSLKTFLRCPEQFRRKYILGLADPSSGSAIAGNAAHKAVEVVYRCRLEHEADAPRALWEEWLNKKFDRDKRWSYKVAGTVDWKASEDDVRSGAVTMAGAYIANVLPTTRPVAVEQTFALQVAGSPVPVVGFIDLIDERYAVDWKFGKYHSSLDPEWLAQGLIYLIAGKAVQFHSTGEPKKDGTCSWATPAGTHDGKKADLEVERSAANVRIAHDLVRHVLRGIMTYVEQFGVDQPWPGNLVHPWACKSCHFRTNGCTWWPQAEVAELGKVADPFR